MFDKSLWGIPSDNSTAGTTDNIKVILQQQAEYLKSGTNGKVMAKLSKLRNAFTCPTDPSSTVLSSKTADETKDLPDANTLYHTQCYGFEIYTSSYRFRIFEINLSPLYPVSMLFDEGVLEDSAAKLRALRIERGVRENQYVVHTDEEFIETLGAVLSSKKVIYLLYKLQQI